MKILVINQYMQSNIKDSEILPRVGDKVDMFYEPLPSVTQVVVWPSQERLKAINMSNAGIDAIITVS